MFHLLKGQGYYYLIKGKTKGKTTIGTTCNLPENQDITICSSTADEKGLGLVFYTLM